MHYAIGDVITNQWRLGGFMKKAKSDSFSGRHGFRQPVPPITIWDDAPEDFRHVLLYTANTKCKLSPSTLRDIVCGVLRKRPDSNNWSEYPNIWGEVECHVYGCQWFRVYDIAEAIWEHLAKNESTPFDEDSKVVVFDDEINTAFHELGIGWQIRDGLIQARGDDAFEKIVTTAQDALRATDKTIAHNELREALKDISRRPAPDSTGAIQHSMAALECMVRDVTGDSSSTLGMIAKRHPTVFPEPIDQAVGKLWGFASERARHVREGQTVDRHDAHLVVGLAATLVNYLIHKTSPST
jgi:hypothetical protein